ncbi:MAG: hypothetical protein F6K17_18925, partial [Okeania sp. SIO3C4]|nr:hypothetical protein [Okeania sp. SIO3C4]
MLRPDYTDYSHLYIKCNFMEKWYYNPNLLSNAKRRSVIDMADLQRLAIAPHQIERQNMIDICVY